MGYESNKIQIGSENLDNTIEKLKVNSYIFF